MSNLQLSHHTQHLANNMSLRNHPEKAQLALTANNVNGQQASLTSSAASAIQHPGGRKSNLITMHTLAGGECFQVSILMIIIDPSPKFLSIPREIRDEIRKLSSLKHYTVIGRELRNRLLNSSWSVDLLPHLLTNIAVRHLIESE